jgi:prenylcysteine oxidase/farnesylcysteine lyase
LHKITAVTGEQFLAENKINPDFSRDIIQAATRVNYASNLAYIHGLEAMVSFATDDATSVLGGNWKIFDHMVKASQAALNSNTKVASISTAPDHDYTSPKYTISTVDGSSISSSPRKEEYPITFDSVVLATPWQFSDISTSSDVLRHKIDEIPYMKLHVTLFSSPFKLRPGFFGLEDGVKAPSNVYTTLAVGEKAGQGPDGVGRSGFYSISTLKTAINPSNSRLEYVYKIFSPQPVTHKFLTDLLGAEVPATFTSPPSSSSSPDNEASIMVDPITWFYAHWFHSYPIELPRVTFQDPVVGSGVYYTGGIESFISTMETSALMGKNVARLIADDFVGVQREGDQASQAYGQQAPLGSDEL